ncbi:MAG: Cytochrome c551 peroxidase (EC [uncultured Sulfurovum sp.]|uniref:Cytochrome c551 peroxidase (EC) n=1 Tax=uncultured Sulfurovum sp. TaxID=269237 RepID=A0A6S6SRH4_9BACT|nr:MAG: Cytochrome c551 peroxidase (EC [uncultured Sulfurovum sp.]
MKRKVAWALVPLIFIGCGNTNTTSTISEQKVALGKSLFNDTSLSQNRTMSCATCHDETKGFVDGRIASSVNHAVAESADGLKLGDRNVPTASYAVFIPNFGTIKDEGDILFQGGQFLDGRSEDLKEQAQEPFLNPDEMQMNSKEDVVDRVKENSTYIQSFQTIYGENIFDEVNASYEAISDAIAAFEKTDLFAPFDSKYDRMLQGTYTFTSDEQAGMALFSDESRANCVACHPLLKEDNTTGFFTDFTYDNLGVPTNTVVRMANGKGSGFIDHGLLGNADVNDTELDGAFRVSTLRNVAETGPYMHNGVFRDLKTVVHFYNTRDVAGALNPETGSAWRTGEVDATKNTSELGNLGLTDAEEDLIVTFMKTLSDKRYE